MPRRPHHHLAARTDASFVLGIAEPSLGLRAMNGRRKKLHGSSLGDTAGHKRSRSSAFSFSIGVTLYGFCQLT
jgi:hypothetical protein